MINLREIDWFAGILEGEGSFILQRNSPKICMQTSDYDIAERVSRIIGCKIYNITRAKPKRIYAVQIVGDLAVQWMLTLYVLMGLRRKQQILDVIGFWKRHDPLRMERTTKSDNKLAKLLGISLEEVVNIRENFIREKHETPCS